MSRRPCPCRHVGQCPFTVGEAVVDHNNEPLYTVMERPVIISDADRRALPAGSMCATDGMGTVVLTALPIDPDRAMVHANARVGTRCEAESAWWRRAHPAPAPVRGEG